MSRQQNPQTASSNRLAPAALALLCAFAGSSALAQDVDVLDSFRVAPSSILSKATPIFEVARDVEAKDFRGGLVEDALNFNLGVKITPIAGLDLQADAWRQEIADAPAVTVNPGFEQNLPQLYIDDSAINEFNVENPLLGSQLQTSGFDLGASYVWDTSRFGQFTLSTKTTYVQDFENPGLNPRSPE